MLSTKQQEYLAACDHRWNLKIGATGSGKSWLDYAAVIPKRLCTLRGEGAAVMLGNTQGTLSRNILEPMREIWGEGLVGAISSDNTARLFGRRVHILGADSKKHVSRIQGMTIEYAYGDEMTTWDEDVFQMLKTRLRCAHSHFDGTANPANPQHFIKKFIDDPNVDVFCQTSTIDDNPFLPPGFVQNLKHELAGTIYYDRFILGRWTAAQGLIYSMFDRSANVYTDAETPVGMQAVSTRVIACDYGTRNPTVYLDIYDNGQAVRVHREYRWDSRKENRQKTDDEYANDFMAFMGDTPCAAIVDPSAASFIMALRQRGVYVIEANNAVLSGIQKVARLLARRVLLIHESCTGLLDEMEAYRWDDKAADLGVEKPVKELDHGPDALRYYTNSLPDWRFE